MMFFILQPFLTAILAAAILSALFDGWYRSILHRTHGKVHLSATLTLLIIAAIIIVPLFSILGIAISEANVAYDRALSGDASATALLETLSAKMMALPYAHFFINDQTLNPAHMLNSLKGFSQNIFGFVQALYQGIAHFVFWLFVMFFSLFYFLIAVSYTHLTLPTTSRV